MLSPGTTTLEAPQTTPLLQLLARLAPVFSSDGGHRWSTVLTLVQITQNNIIVPLADGRVSLPCPLVPSVCSYTSSLPVVYSNVVLMEQLVVTWGWLCCSHSDMLKGDWGMSYCCLWSVDDSPACCTSTTLILQWEGRAPCILVSLGRELQDVWFALTADNILKHGCNTISLMIGILM